MSSVTSSQYGTPHYASDDFGDEASYAGYLRMYERFNPDQDFGVGRYSKLREREAREANKPKFSERHFWGMGEWGKRAGKWGEGIKAYLGRDEQWSRDEQWKDSEPEEEHVGNIRKEGLEICSCTSSTSKYGMN